MVPTALFENGLSTNSVLNFPRLRPVSLSNNIEWALQVSKKKAKRVFNIENLISNGILYGP